MPGLEELEKNDAAERSETTAAATTTESASEAQSPSEPTRRRRPGGRASSKKKRGRPKGSSNKPKNEVAETPDAELSPAPVVVPLEKCELAVAGTVKMITKLTSRGRIEWTDEELEEWGKYWGAPLQPFMSVAGRASPWIIAVVGSANLIVNKLAEQGEAGKSEVSESLEAGKVEP